MLKFIDNFLNSMTMYRVVLYGLVIIVTTSIILGFLNFLPYTGIQQLISVSILLTVGYIVSLLFSKLFRAVTNFESSLITILILFCIFSPVTNQSDALTLVLAAVIAMASKYILAINKKHIFNPAGFAALALAFNPVTATTWWVGNDKIFPVVLIVGLLIVRKIRRFNLFFSFLITSILITIFFALKEGYFSTDFLIETFVSWPLIFLGTVMLTEPQTTPPTRVLQIAYGVIVGALYASHFQIGPIFSTPEFALIMSNIFSYIVSPKQKLFLTLTKYQKIGSGTYEFIFNSSQRLSFTPGQYLEWTLPKGRDDSRGNRRYFTIASSPTEENIKIGVKVLPRASSFKKKLAALRSDQQIVASQLGGDFTLPKNKDERLVFIAGGIGITPFRSMIQYMLDKNEKRSVVLFHFNKTQDEIVYKPIFDKASKNGLKTVYVLSDKEQISKNWSGRVGRLDEKMLSQEVPDYKERTYYLSGPNALVDNYKNVLFKMGIRRIVTDYFPGY